MRKNLFNGLFFGLATVFVGAGCLVVDNPYNGLPPGAWRGVLQIEPSYITPNPKGKPLPEKLDMEYEDVTQGELPFLFNVNYPAPDSFVITLKVGATEILLTDYTVGKDYSTAKDTLTVRFPGTKNYIRGVFEEKILEGDWFFIDSGGRPTSIPLVARQGQDYLFTTLRKTPAGDVNGKWYMEIGVEEPNPEKAVIELRQQENQLSGILEWQGRRYEYLVGTIQARKLYLSSFDGRDALLLEGKLEDDGRLIGVLRVENSVKTLWQASKNQRK